MAVAYKYTRAHWQSVSKVQKKIRCGIAKFAQDRKGTVAIKIALIVLGPMILVDAAAGLFA